MLDCLVLGIIFVLSPMGFSTHARPHSNEFVEKALNISQRVNDSTVTFIKTLFNETISKGFNNKTRRILFQGNLSSDGHFMDQADIIFPDSYQIIFEHIPRLDGPPECADGSTFCEDFASYPYRIVQNILERKSIRTDLFGKDELPDDDLSFSISNRNGNVEEFICTSVQKTIFPKVGKTKSNKWKYIINQEESEGYIQGVRVELCRREGLPCDLIGDIPNGYITKCKQKYILRRLMSLSNNGDPSPDSFQIPSACCCSYRKDFGFLSGIGEAQTRRRDERI